MVETDGKNLQTPAGQHKTISWLLWTLVRPGRGMGEVGAEGRSVWLIPMLLLTVLTLISVIIAGPLHQEAIRSGVTTPESFQYMTPEQQQQYLQAQEIAAGPVTTYIFPAVGKLIGLWLGWFLLGGILHLVLTMLGSRSNNTTAFNLAAWSSLPLAIRLIVQIVAMLVTHQLISSPGLSGFIAADGKGGLAFVRGLLSMVDIYLIWQIVLLWIGASTVSGLVRGKAFAGAFASVVLLLLISALPGFLGAQFQGLNVTQPFFF